MMATRVLMVELVTTKTKHCREIARIIIYLFPSIKARACSRIKFSFENFWSLTIPGGDRRERWIGNAYEHESYTDYKVSICLVGGTTTEGDLHSTPLSFVAQ